MLFLIFWIYKLKLFLLSPVKYWILIAKWTSETSGEISIKYGTTS